MQTVAATRTRALLTLLGACACASGTSSILSGGIAAAAPGPTAATPASGPPAPSTPAAAAPAPSASATVLYDPTRSVAAPNVRMLVGPDKLSDAESKRILDRVFNGNYLADASQCRGQDDDTVTPDNAGPAGPSDTPSTKPPDPLAAARARGDFVPSVFEAATGSFTAPRSGQTLYLITVGECGATHAQSGGSDLLAVVRGDTVLARATVDGGSSIRGLFDLDGDGQNEILLTTGFTNQGDTIESARLARFDRARLVDLKAFGQVLDDSCGSGLPGSASTGSILRADVQPGKPMRFSAERVTTPCP